MKVIKYAVTVFMLLSVALPAAFAQDDPKGEQAPQGKNPEQSATWTPQGGVKAAEVSPKYKPDTLFNVTDFNIDTDIMQRDGVFLLYFWNQSVFKSQRGIPFMMGIKKASEKYVTVAKCHAQFNPEASKRFGVKEVPVAFLISNGKIVKEYKDMGEMRKVIMQDLRDAVVANQAEEAATHPSKEIKPGAMDTEAKATAAKTETKARTSKAKKTTKKK